MTLPTVLSLQRLVLPPGTRLVAGHRGLGHEVTWPATLRTRAPAFPTLKGGEFLLVATTTLALLDPALSLLRLLQGVSRVGVAGAAIQGEVPADCVEWADAHGLPLLQLPAGAHLAELESAIARTIADARREFDRRTHDLYRQLTQLAIEERGLAAVVDELGRVTGKPPLFLDARLQPRLGRDGETKIQAVDVARLLPLVRAWLDRVPASAAEPPVHFFALTEERGLLLAPVLTREGVSGFTAVAADRRELDELDRAAVAGAAAAGAIELARERAVLDAEERAQAGALEELVAGSTPLSEPLRRRAARLQVDLEAEHVVAVSAGSGQSLPSSAVEAYLREARSALGDVPTGLVGGRLVVVARSSDRRLAGALDGLRESLARRANDATLATGVGRGLSGLAGIRQSYREASEALRLGREIFGPGRTTLYADLGLYRLLLTFRDHPELERFYRETIGKLAVHDAKSEGELLRTLEAYFASNGSPTEAATRLHIHRNTLLYRLQRIRAVAELDLDDPDVRLSLQVALRIRRILEPDRLPPSAAGASA